MLYSIMIYDVEGVFGSLPEAEQAEVFAKHRQLQERLAAEGTLRGTAKLMPASTAVNVRQVEGETVVMDGPFAETKEQFVGVYFVECDSVDYALQAARDLPQGYAQMEVRGVEWSSGF